MAAPTRDAPRTLALRALLTLPNALLRGLAGGGVCYVGGRTLDPRLQLLASLAARNPPVSAGTPEEARVATHRARALLAAAPDPSVRIESISVPGGDGAIGARLYRPGAQSPRAPVLVFAHGGAGVVGGLEDSEAFCALLARFTGGPVLSIDYRLAPEHRFPAALEDMLAAFAWARANAARLGAPDGVAAVGGEAMGACLAALACARLREAGEAQPALQLLICPIVDLADDSPSMTTYAGAYPLSRDALDWSLGHYVGPGDSPADPRLSPLRAADLSGLAPAVIAVAGFDPLSDQGEAYARRLAEAGVRVIYRVHDSLAHGFPAFVGVAPAAQRACVDIAALARDLMIEGTP